MTAFRTITTFPETWENRYARKHYVLKDAVALVAYQKKGLLYWSDCLRFLEARNTLNPEAVKIMDEAASIGLKNGWIYSLQGRSTSERAIISLAGETIRKDKRSAKILEYLGPHLGQTIKKNIIRHTEVPATLTFREHEILSWTAAGKTAWETSEILKISRRTVEFHVGNILKKLDAVNAQQAIAIAVSHGLIAY